VFHCRFDPAASIPAVIREFNSSGRNVVYIREPDGGLVARFEPGENPVAETTTTSMDLGAQ